MIIAIDESGGFDPRDDRIDFFTAAFIREGKRAAEKKRQQYSEWEGKIPPSCRSAIGEVKGAQLEPNHLRSFVDDVVVAEPSLGIVVYGTKLSDAPRRSISDSTLR